MTPMRHKRKLMRFAPAWRFVSDDDVGQAPFCSCRGACVSTPVASCVQRGNAQELGLALVARSPLLQGQLAALLPRKQLGRNGTGDPGFSQVPSRARLALMALSRSPPPRCRGGQHEVRHLCLRWLPFQVAHMQDLRRPPPPVPA